MSSLKTAVVAALFFASGALAQATAGPWQQCGGQDYSGPTVCASGWYCSLVNQWYSQCLQGTATSTTTTTTTTTTTRSTSTSTTTTSGGGSSTSSTPTTTGAGPGPTLVGNYLWIRAVTDPNFHKYLQSQPLYTASGAVLGSYTTAGQFQVINGQLVQLLANGGQLYGSVESRADSTVMKLRVSFVKTAPSASAGTFQWSGDALQWTISSISRPNLSAWLACPDSAGNVALYVNLGSYGYQTPAGCYDHTIHFYNAATASS